MVAINVRELKRQCVLEGVDATRRHLSEALQKRHLRADDFSVRDLARGLIEDGEQWVQAIGRRRGRMSVQEALSAVDTSAFSAITGQIVFNKVKEAFDGPEFLWDKLCTTMPTEFLAGERIPGIGEIGDEAEIVDEGQPYPLAGVNQEYVDLPAAVKRGLIVPITREAIIADRTGLLMKRCADVGKWLSTNKEKRVLDCVFGITNTYRRNGTTSNTYLTSGAYINSHSNPLVDWTDIEAAELLLDAITDPNTGEPIRIVGDTMIVPSALKRTAMRIQTATGIRVGDGSAGSTATYGDNPVKNEFQILTNQYVRQRTGSTTTWFWGKPKEAFVYREVWPVETEELAAGSEDAFKRDIMMQWRASEMGVPGVLEPRYMVRNT